jgi:RNA-splicing ligase RtcB
VTEGIECRKDASVIDESAGVHKRIDAVMAARVDSNTVTASAIALRERIM